MLDETFFLKKNADIIKGLAIILMVIHHTFGFPERLNTIEYIHMFKNIEMYISEFGRICVFMYLFLSGYGLCHYSINNNGITYKEVSNRVLKLLKRYWLIFMLFIPLGILMGKYRFNLNEFIMNFFTISYSYNGEWWFVNTYIIMIMIFPVMNKIIREKSTGIILFCSLIIHVSSIGIYLIVPSVDNIIITRILRLVLIYQLYFIIGYVFCRNKFFDKFHEIVKSKNSDNIFIMAGILILCIGFRNITSMSDFIIGPLVIYSSLIIINKLNISAVFKFMSRHSTNIWLTHSFFCYYYFQNITFAPKYSLLILVWILVMCILTSYVIDKISNVLSFNKNNINKQLYN